VAATYESALDDAADLAESFAARWFHLASVAGVTMALADDPKTRKANGDIWLQCISICSEFNELARLIRGG
jgi:sugar phosphate isomerase/epimerase